MKLTQPSHNLTRECINYGLIDHAKGSFLFSGSAWSQSHVLVALHSSLRIGDELLAVGNIALRPWLRVLFRRGR